MTFRFSQRSIDRMSGVHPDLVKVAHRALEMSPIDFGISQGVRTLEEQKRLYAQGRTAPGPIVTWTMNSLHLKQADGFGHAIDVLAYVKGKVSWDEKLYEEIAEPFKTAAAVLGIDLVCGADWQPSDLPHFQLGRSYR